MPAASSSFPQRIKQAVLAAEPEAKVYLFGSLARGDAHTESDWDFLILLGGPVDRAREKRLRHRAYEAEWDAGEPMSLRVYSREQWSTPPLRWTPFHENVQRERVAV